jgi:flagellar motor switch/type III secretory pathway protein FliN
MGHQKVANVHPIYFLSTHYIASTQSTMAQAVKKWLSDWCFGGDQMHPDIELKPLTADDYRNLCLDNLTGYAVGQSFILFNTKQILLKELVFSGISSEVPDDDVAHHLISQAGLGLLKEMIAHSNNPHLPITDFVADATSMCQPLIHTHITVDEHSIELWICRNMFLSIDQFKLEQRFDALSASLLEVSAFIQAKQVSLLELQDLKVGDVIPTQQLMSTPVQILLNQTAICSGRLAKRNEKLVLRLQPL